MKLPQTKIVQMFSRLRQGTFMPEDITAETIGLVNLSNGDSLLHYAVRHDRLERIPPELLTVDTLKWVNAKGETVLDLVRDNQEIGLLPIEIRQQLLKAEKPLELKGYQQKTVANAHDWFFKNSLKAEPEALINFCPRMGKTLTAAAFIAEANPEFKRLHGRDMKVLWLTHRNELLNQSQGEIERFSGLVCEVEKAEKRAPGNADVVLASVQSLSESRLDDLASRYEFDLIVCDESHYSVARTWMRAKNYWDAKILNMTATAYRSDIKKPLPLGRVLGSIGYQEGIQLGMLVPMKERPKLAVDLAQVAMDGSDYDETSLTEALIKEDILEKSVDLVAACAPGEKTLLYAASVKHGKLLAQKLAEKGVRVGEVYGETKIPQRDQHINALKQGNLDVIISVMVLGVGFNCPPLTQIVNLRPTCNDALSNQMLMRGAAKDFDNPNKLFFWFLDLCDLEKKRQGRVTHMPTPHQIKDRIRKAKELEGKDLTPMHVFLEWFRTRKGLIEELMHRGAEEPPIASPQELYQVFYGNAPKLDDRKWQKLEKAWNSKAAKQIQNVFKSLSCGNEDVFAKSLIDQGYVFLPGGRKPTKIDSLVSIDEANNATLAKVSSAVKIPWANLAGRLQNAMLSLGDDMLTKEEQLCGFLEKLEVEDHMLAWYKPLYTKHDNFRFLQWRTEDKINHFLVYDTKTGVVRKLHVTSPTAEQPWGQLRQTQNYKFDPEQLPKYLRKQADLLNKTLSDDQKPYIQDALQLPKEEMGKLRMSRLAGMALLANKFNKSWLNQICQKLETLNNTPTSAPTGNDTDKKPANAPTQVLKSIRVEMEQASTEQQLPFSEVHNLAMRYAYMLEKLGLLSKESLRAGLKNVNQMRMAIEERRLVMNVGNEPSIA